MDSRRVGVLLRTEMRRHVPQLGRTLISLVALVALGLAIRSPTVVQISVLSLGISLLVPGPAEAGRDRISGDLLHLSLLPVGPGTVAAAKLGSCALLCVLAALAFGVSGAVWMPDVVPALTPARAGLVSFFLAWTLFTTLSCLACAVVLRLGMQVLTNGYLPIATFGLFAGLLWALGRVLPDPWGALQWLVQQGWLPWAVASALLLLTAGVTVLSFRLAASGIRDYRPRPDRMSW